MTAMFPESGVPYTDAINSLPNPAILPNCNPLWYSTSRCQPRFDPAAANAMLAELLNLINRGEIVYDCSRLDNIERAVRYIVQRGLPSGALMAVGPNTYTMTLDPPLTRYHDFLRVIGVPTVNNAGYVTLDVNGQGVRPVLRNDGLQLMKQDLRAGIPVILVHYNNVWYVPYLVQSQVPILGVGEIDGWVRTDGNDDTGDGTANTADKAFRTIEGAFTALGSRYAQSPNFSINLRLGIPGTYEAASITSANNILKITGNALTPDDYRIAGKSTGIATEAMNLTISSCNSVRITGVKLLLDSASGVNHYALRVFRSQCVIDSCVFEMTVANTAAGFLNAGVSSSLYAANRNIYIGNGPCTFWLSANYNTLYSDVGLPPNIVDLRGVSIRSGGIFISASDLSVVNFGPIPPVETPAVTGVEYSVTTNAILHAGGTNIPGDVAGATSTGGQFVP